MKPNDVKYYEVTLDNCDGRRAVVHVWTDGTYTSDASAAKVRDMLRKYWKGSTEEEEAPEFVRAWAAGMIAGRRTKKNA